jgi:hypothetical protein
LTRTDLREIDLLCFSLGGDIGQELAPPELFADHVNAFLNGD